MSKRVIFNQTGGPEVLEFSEHPKLVPLENEVLIQVKANGLNRAEYMFFNGNYIFQPVFPSPLGLEGAGIVREVGDQNSDFKKGDKVCLLPNMDNTKYGYLGEHVLAPKEAIIKMPDFLDFKSAAAFWVAYGTAYGILVQQGGLVQDSNQTVVITAASSSVGIASIQMAKNHGATVIATTRTSKKKNYLLNAGADYVIATQEENLIGKIQALTNGKGFDIAVDPVTGSIVNELAEAASFEARIVLYGRLNNEDTVFPLFPVLGKGIKITGFHLSLHLLNHQDRRDQMVNFLTKQLKADKYNITIDKTFALDEVQDAYTYLASNQQKGKIVLTNFNN